MPELSFAGPFTLEKGVVNWWLKSGKGLSCQKALDVYYKNSGITVNIELCDSLIFPGKN